MTVTGLSTDRFWETKTLDTLTAEEWEAVCDGCAKCCLYKIEDVDSGSVQYTNVACRMLDIDACRCKIYEHRFEAIKDCVSVTPQMVREVDWLPESCAYRRLAEGRGLAWWHPLVSGDPETVRQAGVSVCGKIVPEINVDLYALEDRVVDWFD